MPGIFTIGHSRHPVSRFLELLANHHIEVLLDTRRSPWSRFNPQFNQDRLVRCLREVDIEYVHLEGLGGLRDSSPKAESPNVGWRNRYLRNYADYAMTPQFGAWLRELSTRASRQTSAIMCAEADWRQCHRQIIADYLIACGDNVSHILPDGSAVPAQLTFLASVQDDGTVLYPDQADRQHRLNL